MASLVRIDIRPYPSKGIKSYCPPLLLVIAFFNMITNAILRLVAHGGLNEQQHTPRHRR